MRRAPVSVPAFALAAAPLLAQAGDTAPVAMPDLLGAGLRMLLSLLLVVMLILLAGWLTRRMQRHSGADVRSLRMLSSVHVGTRERVVLVQAGETQLLVGVAPGQVRTLHVLDKPIAVAGAPTTGGSFADALRQIRRRGGKP